MANRSSFWSSAYRDNMVEPSAFLAGELPFHIIHENFHWHQWVSSLRCLCKCDSTLRKFKKKIPHTNILLELFLNVSLFSFAILLTLPCVSLNFVYNAITFEGYFSYFLLMVFLNTDVRMFIFIQSPTNFSICWLKMLYLCQNFCGISCVHSISFLVLKISTLFTCDLNFILFLKWMNIKAGCSLKSQRSFFTSEHFLFILRHL